MNDILNNVDQIHVKLKRNLEILMAFLRTNIENNNNFLLFFRGRYFVEPKKHSEWHSLYYNLFGPVVLSMTVNINHSSILLGCVRYQIYCFAKYYCFIFSMTTFSNRTRLDFNAVIRISK